MLELTQTNLDPGNCWQTAWACVLEVDPAELPDQVSIGLSSYFSALKSYFLVHHEKGILVVSDRPVVELIRPRSEELHILCGPTERTASSGKNHCVVGRGGEPVWDPHPSRVGLLYAHEMQILMPYPDEWRSRELPPCACPACPSPPAKPISLVGRMMKRLGGETGGGT